MHNDSSTSARDPLDRLADDYLNRLRNGEPVSPTVYAERHPELAEQILEFFPALEVMEGLKPVSHDERPSDDTVPRMRQLGEFRILREVGHGGMGVVYEALQESLGRRVALKILPFHGQVDPIKLERFRLESRSAARLHHASIVPVYGVGEHDGVYYYAMQYIVGHGLDIILAELGRLKDGEKDDRIDAASGSVAVAHSLLTGRMESRLASQVADRPMSPSTQTEVQGWSGIPGPAVEDSRSVSSAVLSHGTDSGYYRSVARLGVQVASALAHAHGQGVLHRDIKPSNLLLDMAGHIWVTDFGLAKLEGSDGPTQTGDVLGTFRYMPPERFEGWSDRRGDIYGLGMTLYEMLTLQPAFHAATRARLVEQVLHDSPPPPRKVDPRIPRDLETIVLKAISKEPAERYAAAEAMAADLENYLADRPITARRTSALEQAWLWCRRNKTAAAGLAASLVAVLALVGLIVAISFQSRLHAAWAVSETQRGLAEVSLRKEREFLYANRVLFADREIVENNPLRAEQVLEECPPERRGWEWNYLKHQCHREVHLLAGHTSRVNTLAFSPDGEKLIAGGIDRVVTIWDTTTGKLLKTWNDSRSEITGIAMAPDGRTVATTSGVASLADPPRIREFPSGRIVRTLRTVTGDCGGAAFNRDGTAVVVAGGALPGGDSHVTVFDVSTGDLLWSRPLQDQPAYDPSFSPDGKRVMATVGGRSAFEQAGAANQVLVWDLEGGGDPTVFKQDNLVTMVSRFSPDGTMIASGGYDTTIKIWDTGSGRFRQELRGHAGVINHVAFSPDGRRLASASDDNAVKVWDAATGKLLQSFSGHLAGVYTLAISPDGERVASGGYDGQIKIWSINDEKDRPFGPGTSQAGRVAALAFHPSGKELAAAFADGVVRLYDLARRRFSRELTGHGMAVWALDYSPDGRWIATAGGDWHHPERDGEIFLWNVETGRPVHWLRAHHGIAWTVAFSPDGRTLASGGGETSARDDGIILWDRDSGKRLRSLSCKEGGCTSLAFSRDGRTVAGATGHHVRFWDVETGQEGSFVVGPTEIEARVTFSRRGHLLAATSPEVQLGLWRSVDGHEVRQLAGHAFRINDMKFSPDDARIASVGADQMLKISDPETGQQLLGLHANELIGWAVAFSPDGYTIATGDEEGNIRLWDGSPIP